MSLDRVALPEAYATLTTKTRSGLNLLDATPEEWPVVIEHTVLNTGTFRPPTTDFWLIGLRSVLEKIHTSCANRSITDKNSLIEFGAQGKSGPSIPTHAARTPAAGESSPTEQ